MTNADSENQWIPSPYGRIFTKSKNWVLRLVDGALVLFVDGKVKIRLTLDGKSQPLIKQGVLWADITFRAGQADAIRIDGLPNGQARKLEKTIATCERPYLFDRAYGQILTWLKEGGVHLSQCEQDRRWIPQSWQAAFESRRPHLERSDEDLWRLFRDPSVRARLPGEADYVESVLRIWRRDWPAYWAQKNEEYTRRELVACKDLFDQVESKPLTEEQARAVTCFDDRVLVVASAGSGKTSTMVAKAAYAVHRGIFRPDQILLLAFNKKAADELQERTGNLFIRLGMEDVAVEARTFHSLGLSIIGNATGRKPSVPDWAVDAAAGLRKLEAIVDNLKDRSTEFRTKWDLFRVVFGRDLPEFGSTSDFDGWDRDGNGYVQAIRGERVRSHEERLICDWLFYNGVNYEYEREYEFDTATADHRQYFPDFYYPDIGVYHEHFALNAAGEPPAEFTGYLDGVAWKRAEHKRRGTKLIETTSHQLRTRSLDDVLGKQLTARGVALDPNPDRLIPERGFPPMDNEKLVALVRIFITHAKSNCLTVDALSQRLNVDSSDVLIQRHMMFLEIVGPVLRGWDDALDAEGGIDFEDMLNHAAAHLEAGRYESPFELVMADEFQDASRARARLCRALVNRRGRFFFAVGDDWQSINRFAGSDISVMTDFADWFGNSEVLKLEQTFRCPQELCDVSSRFISKNPNQLTKKVHSVAPAMGPVLKAFQVDNKEELSVAIDTYLAQLYRDLMEGRVPHAREGKVTVFVLGRYNRDISHVPSNWRARYGRLISLSFLSMHRSKGAEADYVILPAMLSRAFPSTRVDDPVLAMAMPTGDTYPLCEERRLFYVALTRARRSVALFTVKGETSSFLNELVKDRALKVEATSGEVIEEERCPACEIGVIVQRTGPYGVFEACSSYPRCEYKPRSGGNGARTRRGFTPTV